ncbi:MAG: type II toxin-antitoxin system RelE/ParE family toxin [Acidobacteria bacterium]|nr:type II toxin-antitoxin system RelE/ParE family toxin [Acidobacteriota bacterium]
MNRPLRPAGRSGGHTPRPGGRRGPVRCARSRSRCGSSHCCPGSGHCCRDSGRCCRALHGDRQGQFSIRINDQWRICFRWSEGDAYEVETTDYH